jgi:hypothetical protein
MFDGCHWAASIRGAAHCIPTEAIHEFMRDRGFRNLPASVRKQIALDFPRPADLEIGDTADSEVCGTVVVAPAALG